MICAGALNGWSSVLFGSGTVLEGGVLPDLPRFQVKKRESDDPVGEITLVERFACCCGSGSCSGCGCGCGTLGCCSIEAGGGCTGWMILPVGNVRFVSLFAAAVSVVCSPNALSALMLPEVEDAEKAGSIGVYVCILAPVFLRKGAP